MCSILFRINRMFVSNFSKSSTHNSIESLSNFFKKKNFHLKKFFNPFSALDHPLATAAPSTTAVACPAAATPNPPLLISPQPFSWAAVVSGQKATGAPSSPRTVSKSFQDVLLQNGPIEQKIPSTFKGEPAVFFTKEEIAKLATPFRYTLVGKFCDHRPSMEIIRNFFISLGLKSLQSVGLLQEKHIVIFITQEEDYTRLLMRATRYISGAPMKVLKWSPDFYPNIESPVVPVWVGLPGLPLHFFEKSALFCIASVLGTPLKIDEPTAKLSRPTVARTCVEVDVSKPRNHRIWLGNDKDGYWQDVIFENPPQYCDFCQVLGHDSTSCFKKNPNMLKEPKKNLGLENTKVEENRAYALPVKPSVKEKTKDTWRKKEIETPTNGKKDEEGWTVVGGKKKSKTHCAPLTETTTAEGKMKDLERPVKLMEVVAPSSGNLGLPIDEVEIEGVVVPAISKSSFKPSENLQVAVALTPLPDFARIRKKIEVMNKGNSELACSQGRNLSDPSSKVKSQASNSNPIEIHPSDPSSVNSSVDGRPEKVIAYLQQVVRGIQGEPSDQNVSQGLELMLISDQPQDDNTAGQLELQQTLDADFDTAAAHVNAAEEKNESKIKPLDCPINSQPSVVSATKCKNSEMGCQLGLEKSNGLSNHSIKGFGNLGFEFFIDPNPVDIKLVGPNPCGLDQDARAEFRKHQPGLSSAAGLTHEEVDLGPCHLNQMGNPPSTQSNFHPKISGNSSPHEDTDNSDSEVSDYFDNYHSDGNFPDDSDWYSEDSESAKFLKGKWKRGYNLRANISRRYIGARCFSS